ncbi:MAG: guanylate kinase [Hydrocarboniphaga sp.]|uniref:guanylate kinase n=1 Tax=Hydrocarboniphaga sp. TaxID=2033016 RepID=UPI00263A0A52|nr:guanylate kinase [Hydrocarboniphaga sp.]MDB5970342.1 guanylate kinase [Hydrocarboniphaga sp.]
MTLSPSFPGGLFILSAPSGGGKTSLSRALLPYLAAHGVDAEISVSYTTRAPRPGEQHGVHYHFVDGPGFGAMAQANEFLEHAEVFGRRYGTGRARTQALLDAGQDVILDIDWQGARQVRKQVPGVTSIFILPPSAAELERRLRSRGTDSDEVIAGRMAAARQEMSHHDEYDYLVINRDFDRAVAELGSILLAPRLLAARQRKGHAALLEDLLASPG